MNDENVIMELLIACCLESDLPCWRLHGFPQANTFDVSPAVFSAL